MMKSLFAILLLTSTSALAVEPAVIERTLPSTVTVLAFENQNDINQYWVRPDQVDNLAIGSGFFYRSDYIVTNAHVIEDREDHILIRLRDNTVVTGEVVATDDLYDVAVIKVPVERPALLVADEVHIGEEIFVVGSPYGLLDSVSFGVVSSDERVLTGTYHPVIQVDAAINHGNSGGAVFNEQGKVVGISEAIFSPGDTGNIGIGFMIPTRIFQPTVDQLIAGQTVTHSNFGAAITLAWRVESKQIRVPEGLKIVGLDPDGSAKAAGFEIGDIILTGNYEPFNTIQDYISFESATPVGTTVVFDVLRGSERIAITLTSKERLN